MSRVFYVNGEFVEEQDAKISVLDRGFLFADAVYEVSTVLDGKLIDNNAHLRRLHRSLDELSMRTPVSDEDITTAQEILIARNNLTEGIVYLQISRGVADRDFAYPADDVVPTLVMFTQTKKLLQDPLAEIGVSVISVEDIRWQRRDIKTVGLLGPCIAKQAAKQAGAHDAWMVEDGKVTEGTSNNAYIVLADGTLKTRQLGNEILSGITRQAVLKLCEQTQTTVLEEAFSIDEVKSAREAFITSASTFVMPVVSIDGHSIGDGKPGPVARRLRELYIETARERLHFDG